MARADDIRANVDAAAMRIKDRAELARQRVKDAGAALDAEGERRVEESLPAGQARRDSISDGAVTPPAEGSAES
jgi:hypothetical protein